MIKIKSNCIISSSAFSPPKGSFKTYDPNNKKVPEVGDVAFCEVVKLGHHQLVESRTGRLHTINVGTRLVCTFGNRYSPDQFEGVVPDHFDEHMELFSRGGVIGKVNVQNQLIGFATEVKILGYVCSQNGEVLNTRNHILIRPKASERKRKGANLILCIGTAMNSGKSHAAAACCYSLSSMQRSVRAAKITGTASLKDILLMDDCGADHIADFTYFGFPSTYMLNEEELFWMFNSVDMKYGNDPKNYLVVEFADGILQRETAMLLRMPEVQKRIHKLVFCAADSSAVYGGLEILKNDFKLVPDALSGLCSSSPLAMREIQQYCDIPILQSMQRDYKKIYDIIQ